jgi:hypothetical protein
VACFYPCSFRGPAHLGSRRLSVMRSIGSLSPPLLFSQDHVVKLVQQALVLRSLSSCLLAFWTSLTSMRGSVDLGAG